MPRDGSGHGDNAIETDPAFGQTIAHGAGGEVCIYFLPLIHSFLLVPIRFFEHRLTGAQAATSGVDRSGKAAAAPEPEKGEAIEGLNASGGGNKITNSGKGPLEPQAEVESQK